MRRFIKHAASGLIFAAGLLLLLLCLSRLFVAKDNNKEAGMRDPFANGILSEADGTVDVLFLGDSESAYSTIPLRIWEKHGITSYCSATPAQKLCYTYELLQRAFKKQSPKIVILETHAIFRNFTAGDSLIHLLGPIMPVFTDHNRWKSLTARDFDPAIKYTGTDISKGYHLATNLDPATADNYMKESSAEAGIPILCRLYLKSIKAFCEKHGARLILVSTPSTANWNTERHNGMKKTAEQLGLDYLDLNTLRKDVPIDWNRDTNDKGDHLNYYGATKVTDFLGRYLASTGLVANHKGDQSYAHWDSELDAFNKLVASQQSK